MRSTRPLVPALLAIGLFTAACSTKPSPDGAAPAASVAAPVIAPPTATAAPTATAVVAVAGPVVSIPAGKLVAGTACGDHPSVPGEELAGEAIAMTAFDVDAYPYPGDAEKPPLTSVSRDGAKQLCEARGRRLCTELEWERACKGPTNTRYEYGDKFDAKACATGIGALPAPSAFDHCASGFGVHAMHGFVWEWTANDWKRGKDEGKVAQRGGFGNAPYAHMRCSGARAADPAAKDAHAGFRCCGGPANPRAIEIPAEDPAPAALVEETAPDDALLARLKRAPVNGSLKDPDGTTSTITKVWRWHPAPKEELFLARYESKDADGGTQVQPLVIRLCEKTVQLIGRIDAPVATMEDPAVKDDSPGAASIAVAGGTVKLTYQFAQVATKLAK